MNELTVVCTMSTDPSYILDSYREFDFNVDNMSAMTKTIIFKGYTYMPTDQTTAYDAFKEFQNKCRLANIELSNVSEVTLKDKNFNEIDSIEESALFRMS